MEFMATPTDVIRMVETARKIEGNPLTLAGKVIGLGADEQRAGIPAWAWIVVGVGAGLFLGFRFAPKARSTHERLKAFF